MNRFTSFISPYVFIISQIGSFEKSNSNKVRSCYCVLRFKKVELCNGLPVGIRQDLSLKNTSISLSDTVVGCCYVFRISSSQCPEQEGLRRTVYNNPLYEL